MQQSPLNLDHYHFLSVSVNHDENYKGSKSDLYPDISKAELNATISVTNPLDEDKKEFGLRLQLSLKPKKEGGYPYIINISIEGFFTVLKDLKQEGFDRENFVAINGSAVLFGVLREMIMMLTSRFPAGPVMLPTVNFLDLKNNITQKEG